MYPVGVNAATTAAAAIAQAIKASGVIVKVEPNDLSAILAKSKAPIVVVAESGVFRKHSQYLTSYKGLAFYTTSPEPLHLPSDAEIIHAGKIWIPG